MSTSRGTVHRPDEHGPVQLLVWSSMPSIHLTPLFRALEARSDIELLVLLAHPLTEARRALGWEDDVDGYAYRFLDQSAPLRDAVRTAWRERHRLHFVHGVWGEPSFALALLVLAVIGGKYAIFSEGQDPRASRSWLKRTIQRVFGRAVLARASAFLPISNLSLHFHESLGATLPPVFPFCYFHPKPLVAPHAPYIRDDQPCQLLFVGRLDDDKGLDTLLRAIAQIDPSLLPYELQVIGDGDRRAAFEGQALSLGIRERITFKGRIEAARVVEAISGSDLLVLPTRWDGWGMVVNEALSVGVPVVTTDWCGAADLIVRGWNGFVFPRDDVSALVTILRGYMGKRERWPEMAAAALATGARVQADCGATYVSEIVHFIEGGSRAPMAPWLRLLREARG